MAPRLISQVGSGRRSFDAISRLGLKNFRSIESASVEIRPLTILVGGNSSGKSSVLAALRLLKQGQTSGERDHFFPLEGTEIELGQFDDLLRQGSEDETVEISLECRLQRKSPLRPGVPGNIRDLLSAQPNEDLVVHLNIILAESEQSAGLAEIQELDVQVKNAERDLEYLALSRSNKIAQFEDAVWRPDWRYRRQLGIRDSAVDGPYLFDFDIEPSQYPLSGRIVNRFTQEAASTFARFTSGGIPYVLETETTPFDVLLAFLARIKRVEIVPVIEAFNRRGTRGRPTRTSRQRALFEKRAGLFENLTSSPGLIRAMWQADILEFAQYLLTGIQSPDQFNDEINNLDTAQLKKGLVAADPGWNDKGSFTISALQESYVPGALLGLGAKVARQLEHMGPLRRGPRRLYAVGQRAAANELGREGEYFAYILRTEKDRRVNPFTSSSLETRPLIEALSYWADQLQVANSINVLEEPGYGRKVVVSLDGLSKPVDWEKVGVGVSQVLPVLLSVLRAEEGSTTLIEQPELHLHPDAQAALADFLLAAAQHGRHLIIETHSDALLTRIRKRVVEETLKQEGTTDKDVTFVFATRDETTGITTLQNVELTNSGSFAGWPKGFADQTAEEARDLIQKQILLAKERSAELNEAP